MSRIALVVCLLITIVGVGCDSGSNFGDEPATSAIAEPQSRRDPASPDLTVDTSPADTASDAASTDSGSRNTASTATDPSAPADQDTSESSRTAVTNSARRNVKRDSEETLDISFNDIQLPIQPARPLERPVAPLSGMRSSRFDPSVAVSADASGEGRS